MKIRQSAINISLPAPLRRKIEQKVRRLGTYGSTSEYVRELIRRDLQRDAVHQVDQFFLDGVNSDPAEPMNAAWRRARRVALTKPPRARKSSRA